MESLGVQENLHLAANKLLTIPSEFGLGGVFVDALEGEFGGISHVVLYADIIKI